LRILVIRTDGTIEEHSASWEQIDKLIGAPNGTDSVNIFKNPENGRKLRMSKPVMIVDDHGYDTEAIEHPAGGVVTVNGQPHTVMAHTELRPIKALKPENEIATAYYHSVCIPGTTHKIVGDVAIIDDEDLAG
jgi:hypothetical protein